MGEVVGMGEARRNRLTVVYATSSNRSAAGAAGFFTLIQALLGPA
jgi:hypothetical protein